MDGHPAGNASSVRVVTSRAHPAPPARNGSRTAWRSVRGEAAFPGRVTPSARGSRWREPYAYRGPGDRRGLHVDAAA
jgi:hypothetical protein